jgi:Tol biopolymer transport system component
MMKRSTIIAIALAGALAAACGEPERNPTFLAPSFDRGGNGGPPAMWSAWSEPVNLGAMINSAASETNENLSPDELSLYFASIRAGGQGLEDLYVSRRASRNSPWEAAVNIGTVINTAGRESGPSLSDDGYRLYFFSTRPGGFGGSDIYVSYRTDTEDDLAWGTPINLGPNVNTAADESGSEYVAHERQGFASLYFNRRSAPVATADFNIYSVPLDDDGFPSEPAAPIAELNTSASEIAPEVSTNGRMVLITSNRLGTLGDNDLWIATRQNVHDAWSMPENLGAPINTTFNDRQASLSRDGRTLIFTSSRPGGFGSDDLWMSTRMPNGEDVP